MKLRPVLLVLLILGGFYYVTTHFYTSGALAPLFGGRGASGGAIQPLGGANGFDLTVASAQPAFDAEEQQNIAVYKKVLRAW